MAQIDGTIVYVFTEHFDQMRGYYQHSLGVEPQGGGPDWCSFDLGGGGRTAAGSGARLRAGVRRPPAEPAGGLAWLS